MPEPTVTGNAPKGGIGSPVENEGANELVLGSVRCIGAGLCLANELL